MIPTCFLVMRIRKAKSFAGRAVADKTTSDRTSVVVDIAWRVRLDMSVGVIDEDESCGLEVESVELFRRQSCV
jgi:hypothetical protein